MVSTPNTSSSSGSSAKNAHSDRHNCCSLMATTPFFVSLQAVAAVVSVVAWLKLSASSTSPSNTWTAARPSERAGVRIFVPAPAALRGINQHHVADAGASHASGWPQRSRKPQLHVIQPRLVDDHALLRRAAEIHTKAPIAGTDWIDEFGTNISSSSSVPFYKTGFGLFGKTRGNDDSVWVDVLKNKLTGPTVINLGHNMNWGPLSVNILERGTSKGVSHLPARRAGTSVRVKPLMPT
jgi:hypothetical protein